MFYALSQLYEGKNINQKMSLRTQLKSVKMQSLETIQSYFRRKLTKFSKLWEDCTQEEARLEAREEKLGDEENQALAAHTRK